MSLAALRAELVRYLREQGVPARAGWPGRGTGELTGPVAAVTVRSCRVRPAGFRNYLGEQWDRAQDRWTERYGRAAEVEFGLDIYAPADAGEEAMQQVFDRMAQALMDGEPEGMTVLEIGCGAADYDSRAGRMKKTARAVCTAYLWTEREETPFREVCVRGGLQK